MMQVLVIDVPFELQKMKAYELLPLSMLSPGGTLKWIFKDNRERWLIDPALVGIDHTTALKQARKQRRPLYFIDQNILADLEWLLSDSLEKFRAVLPPGFADTRIPFEQLARLFISLAEHMPAQTVEAKMVRRVPDVFSEH